MATKFCSRCHHSKARHSKDGCYVPGCTCTNPMKSRVTKKSTKGWGWW